MSDERNTGATETDSTLPSSEAAANDAIPEGTIKSAESLVEIAKAIWNEPKPTLEQDEQHIKAVAANGGKREEVDAFAKAKFRSGTAAPRRRLDALKGALERSSKSLQGEGRSLSQEQKVSPRYSRSSELNGLAWDRESRCKVFIGRGAAIFVLLVSWVSTAGLLKYTGHPLFHTDVKAAVFATLSIFATLGLKLIPVSVPAEKRRAIRLWALGAGVLLAFCYTTLLAWTVIGGNESGDMYSPGSGNAGSGLPFYIPAIAFVAEALIAAAIFDWTSEIADQFRRPTAETNDAWQTLARDLGRVSQARSAVELELGRVVGRIEEMENAEKVYVMHALTCFEEWSAKAALVKEARERLRKLAEDEMNEAPHPFRTVVA